MNMRQQAEVDYLLAQIAAKEKTIKDLKADNAVLKALVNSCDHLVPATKAQSA